ncbi:MAG: branched-chain amino acid ABC transporter permease [Burkholderiales bacterium]|jgi:branched-chain amino acid transport system permease protein|nr:branched-chain amino acid ABC transporter permease [Burkholderiales bacterium]
MARDADPALHVALAGAAMAAAWLAPQVLPDHVTRALIVFALHAIFVVSLAFTNGLTGVFSLGHVAFVALGAYTAGITALAPAMQVAMLPKLPAVLAAVHLGFVASCLAGGAVAAVVALVVGWPILRLSGHYVSVATLGLLVIVEVTLVNAKDITRGARTFTNVPTDTTLPWAVGALVLTLVVLGRIAASPTGRALRAVREDPIAAASIGIGVRAMRLLAFTVAAFFAGAGGGLYAHYLGSFSPATFGFPLTFLLIAMLVVGGMRSLTGALVGTALVTLLSELLRNAERGFAIGGVEVPALFGASQIVLGLVLIAVMVFRPSGLLGDAELSVRWLRPSRLVVSRPKESST